MRLTGLTGLSLRTVHGGLWVLLLLLLWLMLACRRTSGKPITTSGWKSPSNCIICSSWCSTMRPKRPARRSTSTPSAGSCWNPTWPMCSKYARGCSAVARGSAHVHVYVHVCVHVYVHVYVDVYVHHVYVLVTVAFDARRSIIHPSVIFSPAASIDRTCVCG